MNWSNKLTALLGTRYPFVQAPMLGVTTPAMVAAISNEGALGSLPVGGLSPQKTQDLVRQVKQLTDQPFAVNLFAHRNTVADAGEVNAMQDFLERLCTTAGIKYEKQAMEQYAFHSYRDLVQVLIEEQVPIVSFTFGIPDNDSIRRFKDQHMLLAGTATSLAEAKILTEKGIDIIIAQGIEAGGHRGTFLEDAPLPQVPMLELVREIAAAVNTPLLAAGGIFDGATIHAALGAGAAGVQVGSAFIAAEESAAMPSYKLAVQQVALDSLVLTRAFSGRWARGIQNTFIRSVDEAAIAIPPYPIQANLTGSIRAAAQQQDNAEFNALWAGHSSRGAIEKSSAAILLGMIRDAAAEK